jgi:Lysophospholipase L1 and related esterases
MKTTLAALLGLTLFGAIRQPAPVTVFMIGDSTMSDRTPDEAERGWGQALASFFDDGVTVRNFASSGRSTRSFIDEGKWAAVESQLRRGDILIIQFGHNDQKIEDPKRFTNPATEYRHNLERFVTEARARGATPILASSIVRRKFNAHGVLEDTHGLYPIVTREVARDLGAPFIDLQLLTEELVAGAGPDSSKVLYVWLTPGQSPKYPEGRQDDTHLSPAGARAVARLAAHALAGVSPELRAHLSASAATSGRQP